MDLVGATTHTVTVPRTADWTAKLSNIPQGEYLVVVYYSGDETSAPGQYITVR